MTVMRSSHTALIVIFLACASVLGCGRTGANTQVMVVVDAEPGVEAASQVVLVRVFGGARGTAQEQLVLVQEYPIAVPPHNGWPIVIALAPIDRDPTRTYRVEALAYDVERPVEATIPIATVRAISGYVEGQTVLLRLLLQDECLGMPCVDISATCNHGQCVTAVVPPSMLAPFDGDVGPIASPDTGGGDGSTEDASDGAADADVDSGITDAGTIDAGTDANETDPWDASTGDAGSIDSGLRDSGLRDSSLPDSSLPDSSLPDSSLPDSSLPDSGPRDSGLRDSGTDASETGLGDSGPTDSGSSDAGGSGPEAGPIDSSFPIFEGGTATLDGSLSVDEH